MISTGDVKKGIIIELDGQLMKVLDWSHIKMARGSAQVRMKLQNVRKGDIVERTFQAGTAGHELAWSSARCSTCTATTTPTISWTARPTTSFPCQRTLLGDDAKYLVENTDLFVSNYENESWASTCRSRSTCGWSPTEPGFAGDTAAGAKKAATVETGLIVQVPLFVGEGDLLRIDTRTGDYVTRVQ